MEQVETQLSKEESDGFKVLLNEHLGQLAISEDGAECYSLPLMFSGGEPKFSNLCLACGINGVVDFADLCCPQHQGRLKNQTRKLKTKFAKQFRNTKSTKNTLVAGLCFHCGIMNRINRMKIVSSERSLKDITNAATAFCSCTTSHFFQKYVLMAALCLNHGLFAPMILNKVLIEMVTNVFMNLYDGAGRQGRHTWDHHAYVNLVAKVLFGHYPSCSGRASNWFNIALQRMGDGMQDRHYQLFVDEICKIAENTDDHNISKSTCEICSTPATYENLIQIGNGISQYHMRFQGKTTTKHMHHYNDDREDNDSDEDN